MDFGLAKREVGEVTMTEDGHILGTPAYMSPEQCEGRDSVDLRTDVYALGIVIYEMLTGRVPFIGEGYGEILVQHLTQPPVPISQYRMMNPHLEAVVMKALEKRADMRYPTMDEMMRAMSDPVGYVEAHGGIVGFSQRQLMPSTAPIAPISHGRQAPITVPPPMPTPPPGTLTPLGGMATPVPTTLGASSGEMRSSGSKKGFLILASFVVAAAIVAIALVVSKDKKAADGGGGSEVAENGSGSSGSAAVPPDPGKGSQVTDPAPGSNKTVDPGRGSQGAGSAGASAGSSGASAGSSGASAGSSGAGTGPTLPELATITLTTKPAGAKIFVDGVEQQARTPQPFTLPKNGKRVKIVLRLASYEDLEVPIVADEDHTSEHTLKPKKKGQLPPSDPRKGSGGKGSGSGPGAGSSDSDLMKPT